MADGEIRASVLGFGCGSVMGRVGREESLRAMNVAWDAGITLFDTARSYGFGEAEAVLGEFLSGKREQAVIATKDMADCAAEIESAEAGCGASGASG